MHLRLGLLILLFWLVLDQVTKWWILEVVMVPPMVIPVTGFFNLVLGRNSGVIFGLLGGAPQWLLTAFTSIIVIGLLLWMAREKTKLAVGALGLVVGGALGNIVDRLHHGAVTDFLDFNLAGYHWPDFNFADVGIVAGVGLLMTDAAFFASKSETDKPHISSRAICSQQRHGCAVRRRRAEGTAQPNQSDNQSD